MEIAKAMTHETTSIMSMFSKCISSMEDQGIYQWNEHYPTISIIENDIMSGDSYVISGDNNCIAYFSISDEQPAEYNNVVWSNIEGTSLVVHRLAVHPEYQGRGIASKLMDFVERYAEKNNYRSIRLDVYSGNLIARKLYEKNGYMALGEIKFPLRQLPFYCMEKVIES